MATGLTFDEKAIDAIFRPLDQGQKPGVAVGMAIDGRPVYRKGFGLANMELPLVLTASTRMRIHSISKHFACLAYMLLCEDGKAAIDDPVDGHLPGLNPVARGVTMRQLMTHTSGLRDANDLCWQFMGAGLPAQAGEIVGLYGEIDDFNAAPGTTWNYNNGGYLLLTAAIERIAERSLDDVLRERIFEPAGMTNSLLRRRDSDFLANSASMHMTTMQGEFVKYLSGVTNMGAEGGVASTVDDLLRWLRHMDAPVIGTAATWEEMMRPAVLANGVPTGYGLGLCIDRYRGARQIHHSGSGMGANSQMVKLPELGLDIVVITNRHDVSSVAFANRIIDACVTDLDDPGPDRPATAVSGHYVSARSGRILSFSETQGRQVATIDGIETQLTPISSGTFATPSHAEITPSDSSAEPAAVMLNEFGNQDLFARANAEPAVGAQTLVGSYIHGPTATAAAVIVAEDGRLLLRTQGRFGQATYHLDPLIGPHWRARPMIPIKWGGIVRFDPDGGGFYYTSPRSANLRFEHRPRLLRLPAYSTTA